MGRIAYLFGFDSQVEHPFSELPCPVRHNAFSSLKSIDGDISSLHPEALQPFHVALVGVMAFIKTRKSLILNKLGTFEVAFHVLFFQPGEREGILTLYIVISKLFADIHRQFEVASR